MGILSRWFGKKSSPPSTVPDSPQSFGYKITWFAIPTEDPQAVANTIGLKKCKPANWKSGFDFLYSAFDPLLLFVTPSVAGWTFVIPRFPHDHKISMTLLSSLSNKFGHAFYFYSYRVSDDYMWAKAENGKVVRAYAFSIEQDGAIWDKGEVTDEEKECGFTGIGKAFDGFVDEELVINIAKAWSINPLGIDGQKSIGLGLICRQKLP